MLCSKFRADGGVLLATATDPDGTDNLLDVTQSIGVFPDLQCNGAPNHNPWSMPTSIASTTTPLSMRGITCVRLMSRLRVSAAPMGVANA